MKTRHVALVAALLAGPAHAEEGMWRPAELPELAEDLRAAGLKMDAAALADLERGPLAAVVNLNGCTASFVSAEGLVITNHHCATGALQFNAREGADVYETGHTAKGAGDELWAGPAARLRVTLSEEDVTDRFTAALRRVDDDLAAFLKADALAKSLVAQCEADGEGRHRCELATYDGGARRVLIRQLELRDVRLVHAPPRAIGEFGGDVDNWMWPRHSGDWALFRGYVGPDGAPADHADANVPYRPARWLTVSTDGVAPGDLVLVSGFPGRTSRHRVPREVEHASQEQLPWSRDLLRRALDIVHGLQKESEAARVRLTGLEAGLANREKYLAGLLDGFAKADLVGRRQAWEKDLRTYLSRVRYDPQPTLEALEALDAAASREAEHARGDELLAWMLRLPASLRVAGTATWLAEQRAQPDEARDQGWQARDWPLVVAGVEQVMRSQVTEADRRLLRLLVAEAARLPAGRIAGLDALLARFAQEGDETAVLGGSVTEGAVDRLVAWAFERDSVVLDEKARAALMEADLEALRSSEDRLVQLALALHDDRLAARDRARALQGARARAWPAIMFAARRLAAGGGGRVGSDANATLRVTWGHVKGYEPREAVSYAPQTTLRGVLEKDTGTAPFDTPPAVLETMRAEVARDEPGRFADPALGTVPVNFLSTCDTTGGNSGSPTLDAQGRLVGLLFDGNYESMASDWVYDTVQNRSIHVDIRYVLWSLEAALGGAHLLDEMGVGR